MQGAVTLALDVGGSGIKAGLRDAAGRPLEESGDRWLPTPPQASPEALVDALTEVARPYGGYRRCGVGFPGVVVNGVAMNAPNLGAEWGRGPVDLHARLGKALGVPTRCANDADVAALGALMSLPRARRGVTVMVTLGTGFGVALCHDGRPVPNVELGGQHFTADHTFDQALGTEGLNRVGPDRWLVTLTMALERVRQMLSPDTLIVGGGNARWIQPAEEFGGLAIVDNAVALMGCVGLFAGVGAD